MHATQAYVLRGNLGKTYPTLVRGEGVYVYDDQLISRTSRRPIACAAHGD